MSEFANEVIAQPEVIDSFRSCFNFIDKNCYRLLCDDFFAPIEAHSVAYATKLARKKGKKEP